MKWSELNSEKQLDQLREESKLKRVLIFKHSKRCALSCVALNRFERNWNESEMGHVKPYLVDLMAFRKTSDGIARQFQVTHESPQVLIIENGRSVYNKSNFEIEYGKILEASRKQFNLLE